MTGWGIFVCALLFVIGIVIGAVVGAGLVIAKGYRMMKAQRAAEVEGMTKLNEARAKLQDTAAMIRERSEVIKGKIAEVNEMKRTAPAPMPAALALRCVACDFFFFGSSEKIPCPKCGSISKAVEREAGNPFVGAVAN